MRAGAGPGQLPETRGRRTLLRPLPGRRSRAAWTSVRGRGAKKWKTSSGGRLPATKTAKRDALSPRLSRGSEATYPGLRSPSFCAPYTHRRGPQHAQSPVCGPRVGLACGPPEEWRCVGPSTRAFAGLTCPPFLANQVSSDIDETTARLIDVSHASFECVRAQAVRMSNLRSPLSVTEVKDYLFVFACVCPLWGTRHRVRVRL